MSEEGRPRPKPKWATSIDDEIYHSVFNLRCKTAPSTDHPNGQPIQQDIGPFFDYDYLGDPSGDGLIQAIADIASIHAFWSMVLADAKLNVSVCKRRVLRQRGKVLKGIIADAREAGVSVPRRDDVDDMVEDNNELNKFEAQRISAEAAESKLTGVVKSLQVHAEMLRSLAGFKKAELSQQ